MYRSIVLTTDPNISKTDHDIKHPFRGTTEIPTLLTSWCYLIKSIHQSRLTTKTRTILNVRLKRFLIRHSCHFQLSDLFDF